MKKILSVLMCFMVMFGVCVVGTACDPNEETEAEYKARIRKELDAIPIENHEYELALVDESVFLPYERIVYGSLGSGTTCAEKEVDGNKYRIVLYSEGRTDEFSYTMKVVVNGGEEKEISINYNEKYRKLGYVDEIAFFDNKIFVIRSNTYNAVLTKYSNFAPSTLFIYNYELNIMEYSGYNKMWFDYPIYNGKNNLHSIIRKTIQEEIGNNEKND